MGISSGIKSNKRKRRDSDDDSLDCENDQTNATSRQSSELEPNSKRPKLNHSAPQIGATGNANQTGR